MKRIKMMWHGIVTIWRFGRGRWFIFRDRPLWFVVEMAQATPLDGGDREWTLNYINQAKAEMQARIRQAERNPDIIRTLEALNLYGKS